MCFVVLWRACIVGVGFDGQVRFMAVRWEGVGVVIDYFVAFIEWANLEILGTGGLDVCLVLLQRHLVLARGLLLVVLVRGFADARAEVVASGRILGALGKSLLRVPNDRCKL